MEQSEQPVSQEAGASAEQGDETGGGDEEEGEEEDLPRDKQVDSSSHSPDLSTDGSTEI